MGDQNTVDRAASGLGSTMVRAGELLKRVRKDFGHAHEPKRRLLTAVVAMFAAAMATGLLVFRWGEAGALDYAELPTRDLRVNLLETNEARDPDIMIINIDEGALAYGDSWSDTGNETAATERFAWPWPRHVHNKIIRYCREGGARAIVFDLTFKETGPNTNQVLLDREVGGKLTRVWTFDKAGDDLFALEATARDDVALALVLGGTDRGREVRDNLLPKYARPVEGPGAEQLLLEEGARYAPYRSAEVPFAALMDGWPSIVEEGRRGDEKAERKLAGLRKKVNNDEFMLSSTRYRSILPLTEPTERHGVAALGVVTGFNDVDSVQRRFDVVATYDGNTYLCLPLEVWRIYVLSFAREALADPARRARFAERFEGLAVTDKGLEYDGAVYDLANKLQDVPLKVDGRTAHYLGRSMPLDETGRVELRYRNFLPIDDNLDWAYMTEAQREAVRGHNPDGELFAIYPQVSAADILRDWDMINENRYKANETARLNIRRDELNDELKNAGEDEREALETELADVRMRLSAVEAQPVRELALGKPGEMVKDKVVLISSTASVLIDRHRTPLAPNTPGTWVLATYFDNLKSNDFMHSLPRWFDWLLAIGLAVLTVAAVLYSGRLRNGLVLTLLLGVLVIVACWAAFSQQLWFPLMAPLVGLVAGFSNGALAKALTEGHQRRQREHFARQYMGKELVDHVINNPASLKLGGENRPMTMYFSDVAGFTTVTETLGPNNPERLVELLNIYLERMTDLMLGTGGVIDKYIGDAIMCFWGAPMAQEDHAIRACRGALDCRAELQRMQPLFADAVRGIAPQLIKPDGSVLYARAGINSGIVTVGNMGSSKRFAYTVMGDAVNLAARLEPQCKSYGTDILIGEKTEELVRSEFTLRRIDLMVVKGKTQPVQVFELMGDKNVPQFVKDLLEHFEMGIDLFRDRQFQAALEAFKNAEHHEAVTDEDALNPSRLYIERCEAYLKEPPPPEWNGVVVKTSK
ncbi:MAG: adenylate/guanylate cyclase domain-containing protein [Planctomycetes bacterium]|nr:adenylate/guanylate cyclase domain-containing protein [Planctomycetota bacterium]